MKYRNYHTHSRYCDGKDDLKDFAEVALSHFSQLGFSSHAPIYRENNFAIAPEKIKFYTAEIDSLQKQYSQLTLLKSLECDYIPEMTKDFSWFQTTYALDYIIGGIHLVKSKESDDLWFIDGSKQETYDDGLKNVFHQDIKYAVKTYFEQLFEMIETQHFDILAHFDKIKMHNKDRYFTENESWYQNYIFQTLDLIREKQLIVEINTRGLYKNRYADYYPGLKWFKLMKEKNIHCVISTDAHAKGDLELYYKEALEALRFSGYRTLVEFHQRHWSEYEI